MQSPDRYKEAQTALAAWFDDGELSPLGDGHIHDTYRVSRPNAAYVLQRVNEYVFRDGDLVMDQTERLLDCWSRQSKYIVPQLVESKKSARSFRDDSGLWRVWRFIGDGRTIDPVENTQQAEGVGRAFGELQSKLAEISGPPFRETIEGFLNLAYYLDQFSAVAEQAPEEMRQRIEDSRYLAETLMERQTHIHGDCKVNNVLFKAHSDEVIAVIDFDTAMHGHWAWDFGDLIRSVCFSAGGYRAELFEACLKGFASAQPLTNVRESVIAPAYVALMLGVRFLTDHLQGDVYFKTNQEGQNLERAKEQFAILDAFLTNQGEMEDIADRVITARSEST